MWGHAARSACRRRAALEERAGSWRLGGEQVPVVSQYRYLGSIIRSDLGLGHIVADRVTKGRRAIAALGSIIDDGDIPINLRVSVVKACVLPVLTYGCEVWGMSTACGINKLQTLLNRVLRRMLGVGRNAPGVAVAPILREFGIPPVEAIAASARARSYLKAAALSTYITVLVGSPSRVRPNTWTSGTVRWMDRVARMGGDDLPAAVRVPREWGAMAPTDAKKLVKASVWVRSEASGTRTNAWTIYAQAMYGANPLPQHSTSVPPNVVRGVHLMIQLRTRVFPTLRRLARIKALPDQYLDHCPLCGDNVPETVEHMLSVCPRWNSHRQELAASAPEFASLVSSVSSGPRDDVTLVLGGVPPALHGAEDFKHRSDRFFVLWRRALPKIALFVMHVTDSRRVCLSELGLALSRATRTGRRPDG